MRFKRKFSFCFCGNHSLTKQDIGAMWKALLLGTGSIGVSFVSDNTFPVPVQVAASIVATGLFLAGVFVFFEIPKR